MKLRAVTYNIHKGVGGIRPQVRIHDIRSALSTIDADILFLQEVQDRNERHAANMSNYPSGTQLDFLCHSNYAHRAYGMNAVYPHGHHGNAILSRHSIANFLNHDISDHALEKRGLLHAVAHIQAKHGLLDLHLINVHFGLIKQSRVRQARFLIDFVRREIPAGAPLLIGGDFNDWQRRVDDLLHDELDVHEAARKFSAESPKPRMLDRLMPWRAAAVPQVARTFPSMMPCLTLDRLYVRGFHVKAIEVPRGGAWSRRSDHSPLIVDLELA